MYWLPKIFQRFLLLTMCFGKLSFAFLCFKNFSVTSQGSFDLKKKKKVKYSSSYSSYIYDEE